MSEDTKPQVDLSEGVRGDLDAGAGAGGAGGSGGSGSTRSPGHGGSSRRRRRKRGGPLAAARELALIVIGALVVSSLLRAFVGQPFVIPSQSMENTLLIGDKVIVEKVSDVKRGDVVVFQDPGGWLTAEEEGKPRGPVGRFFEWVGVLPDTSHGYLTKRLIGLPGDHIVCCNTQHQITINGHALDETYLPQGTPPSDEWRFDLVVPAGRAFVLGDNRDASADSRFHFGGKADYTPQRADNAFVPLKLIEGRAIWIAWPLGRIRTLKVPATYAGVPPPTGTPPAVENDLVKVEQTTPG